MQQRVITLVQARMNSTRLPGKAMRPLLGRPMLLHVLERAKAMGFPTWLVTSVNDVDSILSVTAGEAGYQVYRGSEWDVLRRMREAADVARAEVVVRVTADCPLFAPDVGAQVVDMYRQRSDGIASNDTSCSGWPDGLDVEVFSADLLRRADRESVLLGRGGSRPKGPTGLTHNTRHDREHVTPWMRRNCPHHVLSNDDDWAHWKLSVDTLGDFRRVARVMSCIETPSFRWAATREACLQLQGEGP